MVSGNCQCHDSYYGFVAYLECEAAVSDLDAWKKLAADTDPFSKTISASHTVSDGTDHLLVVAMEKPFRQ